ncbi:hypothetical protein [Bacillus sp. EB01]|uniref:hypothetical protein n=1 Tax=Bacillus sp. EB01 TaxID=1347086 RepID=UPI0005C48C5D|nr:hypothetical protein [Bacillus sp. EB01]
MDKEKLIEYLLDENIDDATRDDCAIDLSNFPEEDVIAALIKVANNLNGEEMIRASCGESIASIWLKIDKIDFEALKSLEKPAYSEAIGLIRNNKPHWYFAYEKYNRKQ